MYECPSFIFSAFSGTALPTPILALHSRHHFNFDIDPPPPPPTDTENVPSATGEGQYQYFHDLCMREGGGGLALPPRPLDHSMEIPLYSQQLSPQDYEETSLLDVSNESTFYKQDVFSEGGVETRGRENMFYGRPPNSVHSSQVCNIFESSPAYLYSMCLDILVFK